MASFLLFLLSFLILTLIHTRKLRNEFYTDISLLLLLLFFVYFSCGFFFWFVLGTVLPIAVVYWMGFCSDSYFSLLLRVLFDLLSTRWSWILSPGQVRSGQPVWWCLLSLSPTSTDECRWISSWMSVNPSSLFSSKFTGLAIFIWGDGGQSGVSGLS